MAPPTARLMLLVLPKMLFQQLLASIPWLLESAHVLLPAGHDRYILSRLSNAGQLWTTPLTE